MTLIDTIAYVVGNYFENTVLYTLQKPMVLDVKIIIALLISLPLGALLFRVRGGYLAGYIEKVIPSYGATKSRLLCSIGMALYVAVVASKPILIAMAIPIYIGLPMGWLNAADIGRDKDRTRIIEFLLMLLRGAWLTLIGGMSMVFFGYHWYYTVSGLLLPVAYELAHRTPSNIPSFNRGMEMGETYMGAILLFFLTLSVAI